MLQITGTKEYTNPQDCFADAMAVMADKNNPNNMACIPIQTKGT